MQAFDLKIFRSHNRESRLWRSVLVVPRTRKKISDVVWSFSHYQRDRPEPNGGHRVVEKLPVMIPSRAGADVTREKNAKHLHTILTVQIGSLHVPTCGSYVPVLRLVCCKRFLNLHEQAADVDCTFNATRSCAAAVCCEVLCVMTYLRMFQLYVQFFQDRTML